MERQLNSHHLINALDCMAKEQLTGLVEVRGGAKGCRG